MPGNRQLGGNNRFFNEFQANSAHMPFDPRKNQIQVLKNSGVSVVRDGKNFNAPVYKQV